MSVPSNLETLSPTAQTEPNAGDSVSSGDDNFRAAFQFIRQTVTAGADIASAITITPPSTGASFNLTGVVTVTAIASTNSWDGRIIWFRHTGAHAFTNSATLVCLGGASITFASGDISAWRQRTSGTWDQVVMFRADGSFGTALNATNLASGTVPDARFPATLPAASGVNLTALNGTNIASGTVAFARLASITAVASGATDGTNELGFKGLPSASVTTGAFVAADKGKCVMATAGVTIPNSTMTAQDVVIVQNTTGSGITITKTVTTAYNTNTGTALGATFTLAARGRMAILFSSATECYVSGNIS